jgi:hypothetical protein
MSGTSVAASVGLAWLYTTLGSDSTLSGYAPGGVWRYTAPPGTATPFLIINPQSMSDKLTMNAYRIYSSDVFLVKAVAPETQYQQMINATSRVDALINTQRNLSITGGTLLACFRESEFAYSELVNGDIWQNIGGLYRLMIE